MSEPHVLRFHRRNSEFKYGFSHFDWLWGLAGSNNLKQRDRKYPYTAGLSTISQDGSHSTLSVLFWTAFLEDWKGGFLIEF